MNACIRFLGAFVVAACAAALLHAQITASKPGVTGQGTAPRGQSTTRLADGRWLIVGGEDLRDAARAAIYDPVTGTTTAVPGLAHPRAWHTATVLPDGTVLVMGGQGRDGQPVSAPEAFDPATSSFFQIAAADTVPRRGHTATLLTDGRVLIVGGVGKDGVARADAELWSLDPEAAVVTVRTVASPLNRARAHHRSTLQADGSVLIEDVGGRGTPEAFRLEGDRFVAARISPSPDQPVAIAESRPADGAVDIAEDARIVVRFSAPVTMDTAGTVELTGPAGAALVRTVLAESGRLLFIRPLAALDADAEYVLRLTGFTDGSGRPADLPAVAFSTRRDPRRRPLVPRDTEEWIPDADSIRTGWRTGRPDSPWAQLPPLHAADGVTALAGQVLRLDGRPLADVTLRAGSRHAETDRTGRFLLALPDAASGRIEVLIDGRTANTPRRTYGVFEIGVPMIAGRTTVLPYTVWMPLLDTGNRVRIPSPTTGEIVIKTPRIPGLELHLPAGTVIRDHEGKVVRELSITPIPLDRPPFALPSIEVPVYFTIQPGGGYVYTSGAGPKGAWLVYPNGPKGWAGKRIQFFHYEPEEKDWYVYGLGTVTPSATQVVPDATTRLYEFNGAMINMGWGPPADAPPPGDCCGDDGDPVNLSTGLFELEQTDLSLPDVLPIAITRTYRTRDLDVRPFGIGATHQYAAFLWSANQYQEADLVLPDGARIHYVRTSPGTGFMDAVFEHKETANTSATPTAFYKSTLTWNAQKWDLRLKDGTVYVMGENAPMQAIRDRHGNTITLTWSGTNAAGSGIGNLLQVTSPYGRSIGFTYDSSNRITEVKDHIGRTVSYTYDAEGRLWKVTDPLGQVTEYTYDADHRMLTVKNRNGVILVTNEYTTSADTPTPLGWVKKQTFADGGVYNFAYTVVNGRSTLTDVTNPRGFVRRVAFNADGYTLSDTRGLGTPDEQVTLYGRPSANNFIGISTDNLLRQTAHTYDSRGNETGVTWLAGTAEEVTATDTFDPLLNQLTSATDQSQQTTTFEHDAKGNVTAEVSPTNVRTTSTYNLAGQVTSATDALQNTTFFAYEGGDLKTVQDPLSRITTQVTDAAGRLVARKAPSGATTRHEYDALNRLTKSIDALGGETTMSYLPEGQVHTITDARQNTTTYAYDVMGRLVSRTDPIGRTETFGYDLMGNLTTHVDRSGQTLLREYDSVGRLHQITYADSSTIIYGYDGDGRPVTVQDSVNGTIERTYDGLSRLTSETTPQGSVSYTYDAVGRRATMTVTGEPTVEYEYDAAGRLETVTQGTAVVSLEYDDANRRTSLTLPNGVVTEYAYDASSQLTALTYRSGPTVLGDLTYTYDLDGRRSEVGGTLARTSLPQSVATAAYDNANQLTQWASRILSYDLNGNLRSDGYSDFIWNTRQQLVGLGGGASGAFGYDSEGRRTQRTVGLTTASYLYAGQDTVREQITNGPTATRLAGENVDEWWSRTEPAGQLAPLVDAQGSAIALADASGMVVTHYTYEPFGRTTTSGASTPNRFAFTGRETDQDALAGLYYYRARYYDSALGRFVSTDPLGMAVGMNSYEYVENDPLNATDPTGLYSLKGFPPARHAQMRRAIRDLYTRLKQNPCCIEPSLRDRVLQLIHPGENGAGVTFQYRNVIPVPSFAPRGAVVCGMIGGPMDFVSRTAQISRAAMDGTCGCPLPGTLLHEVVHLTFSNALAPWSAEREAYAAAEACFGPVCAMGR